MIIDALVAEIGSTTTIVNAFDKLNTNSPKFLGSGYSPTTVLEGDVTIGLNNAIQDLKNKLNISKLIAKETFASSSAAGGLKMSVHGLVYDMTVKAAKEAALGAGANIKLITSGVLDEYQLQDIVDQSLNIIMIAGGVNFGERKTAIKNAKKIANLKLNIPVIYAGNIQNQKAIKKIFIDANQDEYIYISENVYPKIDSLHIEQSRKIIQKVFEEHIIHAPGMNKVKSIITDNIIPTPGAVMEASILLQKEIGDLVTIDVGGATTDIHSVTLGTEEIEKILIAPEPFAKRTVEGDLGVYINKDNIIRSITEKALLNKLNISKIEFDNLINNYEPIPKNGQIPLTEELTKEAILLSIERHSGKLISLYNASGKTTYAEGKDLTNIKYIIATGGALTKLPNRLSILKNSINKENRMILKPKKNTKILIDNNYIMASLGVLSKKHPVAALKLLKESLEIR